MKLKKFLFVGVIMSSIAAADEADFVLYSENGAQVVVPSYALASGSLQITSSGPEAYALLQKVAAVWQREGIDNYLVYRRSDEPGWEIVPVSSYARQIAVLARVTFGRYRVSEGERQKLFVKYQNIFSEHLPAQTKTIEVANDAFCQKKVIESQLVLSGKHINVLYNYAPIKVGKEELHFLLVPKNHRANFNDLTEEEFIEASELSEKLCAFYGSNISYQYHKTGSLAGQTVPHWHQHLVFVEPGYDLLGKLSILFRMAITPKPLPPAELERRVVAFRGALKDV